MVYWILHKTLTESDLKNPIEGNPGYFYKNLENFAFVDLRGFGTYAKIENKFLGINKLPDLLKLGISRGRFITIKTKKNFQKFIRNTNDDDIFVIQSLADIRTMAFLRLLNKNNKKTVFLNHWKIPIAEPVALKKNVPLIKKIFQRNYKLLILRVFFKFYSFFLKMKKQNVTFLVSSGNKMTEKARELFFCKNIVPVHSVTYNEYLQSRGKHERIEKDPYYLFVDQALTIHPDNKSFKDNDTVLYHDEIMNALKFISEQNNGIKILIAAHPRCQYDKGFWGQYPVYLGQTARLIADAEAVIGHFSTSLALAQIYKKKIYLLESSSTWFPFNSRVEHSSTMLSAQIMDMRTLKLLRSCNEETETELTDYLTLLPDSKVENNELFMQFFARFDKKNLCWETACCVPKYQFFEKSDDQKIAGTKAPSDAELFAEQMGFKPLYFFHWGERDFFHRLTGQLRRLFEYIFVFFRIRRKSILFLQFPYVRGGFLGRCMFFKFVRIFKKIKVITLIHDLNELRYENSDKEIKLLDFAINCSDFMIAHNENMCDYLAAVRGVSPKKLVSLDLFDYYVSEKSADRRSSFEKSISIAGNLDANKSAYLRELPNLGLPVYLYGKNYNNKTDNKNIVYKGCFEPECITNELCHGFGLVWDGISADTCDGLYGKYLKYNNPHKLSMYLTAGLPVIVWKESALCEPVVRNKLGIAVSSLYEAVEKIKATTESEYLEMRENCLKISAKLRNGYFLKTALRNCLEKLAYSDFSADSVH